MRILHTSDWHLGRAFGPVSLLGDQAAFADWLVALVTSESVDLVVIAGDIYDRAIAPKEAIELFRDTVRRLLGAGAVVAAITGNHDGADRVAPYDDLLDLSGLYLRGGYQGIGGVITHAFADGPLDLVLLPFLDPQAAPDAFGADAPAGSTEATDAAGTVEATPDLVERRRRRTHDAVLATAIDLASPQLAAPRSLAIAHAFVTGGTVSDSERQLVVGGTGEVPSALFDEFSYTALGHLHRPQEVAREALRYSGTPLAYSFSEEHEKSVVLIDMDPIGGIATSLVSVAVGRPVRTITGTIDQLLDPGRHADAHGAFVRAIVTDRDTVLDAKARLSEVYRQVVEVKLQPVPDGTEHADAPLDVGDLDPIDATRAFWDAAEGSPPEPEVDSLLVEAVTGALAAGRP